MSAIFSKLLSATTSATTAGLLGAQQHNQKDTSKSPAGPPQPIRITTVWLLGDADTCEFARICPPNKHGKLECVYREPYDNYYEVPSLTRCGSQTLVSPDAELFVRSIVGDAVAWLTRRVEIKVQRTCGDLLIPRVISDRGCIFDREGIETDAEFRHFPNTDLVLYVTMRPVLSDDTIAYAGVVHRNGAGRPIAAAMNISPKSISEFMHISSSKPSDIFYQNDHVRRMALKLILHEIVHALGYPDRLYSPIGDPREVTGDVGVMAQTYGSIWQLGLRSPDENLVDAALRKVVPPVVLTSITSTAQRYFGYSDARFNGMPVASRLFNVQASECPVASHSSLVSSATVARSESHIKSELPTTSKRHVASGGSHQRKTQSFSPTTSSSSLNRRREVSSFPSANSPPQASDLIPLVRHVSAQATAAVSFLAVESNLNQSQQQQQQQHHKAQQQQTRPARRSSAECGGGRYCRRVRGSFLPEAASSRADAAPRRVHHDDVPAPAVTEPLSDGNGEGERKYEKAVQAGLVHLSCASPEDIVITPDMGISPDWARVPADLKKKSEDDSSRIASYEENVIHEEVPLFENSHFPPSFVWGELMVQTDDASATEETWLTDLSLAMLDASPHYEVTKTAVPSDLSGSTADLPEYEGAEIAGYGFQRGCNYVLDHPKNWDPKIKSEMGFCDNLGAAGCTYDRERVGVCENPSGLYDMVPHARIMSRSSLGGTRAYSCVEHLHWTAPGAVAFEDAACPGPRCRCFMDLNSDKGGGSPGLPHCREMKCSKTDGVWKLSVSVGGALQPCSLDGDYLVAEAAAQDTESGGSTASNNNNNNNNNKKKSTRVQCLLAAHLDAFCVLAVSKVATAIAAIAARPNTSVDLCEFRRTPPPSTDDSLPVLEKEIQCTVKVNGAKETLWVGHEWTQAATLVPPCVFEVAPDCGEERVVESVKPVAPPTECTPTELDKPHEWMDFAPELVVLAPTLALANAKHKGSLEGCCHAANIEATACATLGLSDLIDSYCEPAGVECHSITTQAVFDTYCAKAFPPPKKVKLSGKDQKATTSKEKVEVNEEVSDKTEK